MFEVHKKEYLAANIVLMDIYAPLLVANANPGQFLIVKTGEKSERIPLTICDYDKKRDWLQLFFKWLAQAHKRWQI